MWTRLNRKEGPESSVLSLQEMKAWTRQDVSEDDGLLEQLIEDATDYIDGPSGIGIALAPQTWELSLDGFPSVIEIPLGPVLSVDSIQYVDTDGADQTLDVSKYRVDSRSNPARITPAYNETWPTTRDVTNAVNVTFRVGHESVPNDLKRAVALLASHWYEHRSAVNIGNTVQEYPLAVNSILNKYRVGRFA